MAMNFRLTEEMDVDTLAQIGKLREKNGLHVEYQYGLRAKNFRFDFPSPKYDGCSLRVFIYNKVSSFAKVNMSLEKYSSLTLSSVALNNRTVMIQHENGWQPGPAYKYSEPIGLSRFFSMGLRMNGYSIHPLVNEWVGNGYYHGIKISDRSWVVEIYSGENYIVSLHICDEVGGSFPGSGLNQRYAFNFVLPVGSYLTIFAVFVGGTSDGQDIWIGFQQDNGKYVGKRYGGTPMKPYEEFRISARNSNEGWLLATSFLGINQDTEVVARNNQEQFMHVQVSNNCYIKRIMAVSAVIPEQYKPT